jgi:spore coat protein A
MDPITETPLQGSTEVWEIWNYTMDAHPIHLHQVMFEVVERESRMDAMVRPPELWELGYKDTVIAYPGEITRVKAYFDLAGLYVWHCHIVEHEDNEMMRPYRVLNRINLPLIGT